ncbi:hypothetical protein DYB37_012932, partial [Aphanomyces astaci]
MGNIRCTGNGSERTEEPAAAQAAEDVDMGFDNAVKVLNAPALPQPPSFKGSTESERRAFMREYQRYTSQIMVLQSMGQRPFLMPLGACMDLFSTDASLCGRTVRHQDPRRRQSLDNLMKTLEADGQEWVIYQEGKLVVGIITKAIKPAPLQLAVTKQLQLHRNKVLKSDVFRYVKWLRQFAIGYQLPVREEKRPSGASVVPPTWRADKRDEPSERPKPKCLKCQSTAHRVREHPGITDAEVKKLMDDFHQARRRSVNFVSSTKPANSMECQASIEDVLTIPKVLLDSGSDETLVSEGLLVALERLGAMQFKTVTLETSIGPLVLRGLRAWVEEKRMEIDVLIGRPVMERLGFSVDGMLVDALKQRRVWDMAEAGDADQTSANVKRLQEAFQEDPEDALYAEDVA